LQQISKLALPLSFAPSPLIERASSIKYRISSLVIASSEAMWQSQNLLLRGVEGFICAADLAPVLFFLRTSLIAAGQI